jgi:hypothetical protein
VVVGIVVAVVVVVKPKPYTQANGLTCPHIIHKMYAVVREDKTYFRLLAETGQLIKRNF